MRGARRAVFSSSRVMGVSESCSSSSGVLEVGIGFLTGRFSGGNQTVSFCALRVDDSERLALRHADRQPPLFAIVVAAVEKVLRHAIAENRTGAFEANAMLGFVESIFRF